MSMPYSSAPRREASTSGAAAVATALFSMMEIAVMVSLLGSQNDNFDKFILAICRPMRMTSVRAEFLENVDGLGDWRRSDLGASGSVRQPVPIDRLIIDKNVRVGLGP